MKPDGMYRKVYEYDDTTEWECFACRRKYHSGCNEQFNFCPYCGIKYTKLWMKINKRYEDLRRPEYKYKISYQYKDHVCGEWKEYTYGDWKYLFLDGYHVHIKGMMEHTFKNYLAIFFRIVIKRPDGSTKEVIIR